MIRRWFPPGTQVCEPDGGFAVWIRLPPGSDGQAVFRRARERGIAIGPGAMFAHRGAPFREWIRLAPGIMTASTEDAIRRLGEIVQE